MAEIVQTGETTESASAPVISGVLVSAKPAEVITVSQALTHTDGLKPNQYEKEVKIGWLSKLDGIIWDELIKTHEDELPLWWEEMLEAYEGELPSFARVDLRPDYVNTANAGAYWLRVPRPYGEDIYHYWLAAQIDKENGEIDRFNQNITMFNAAYEAYANWYNRTHMPRRAGERWKF